MHVRLDSAGYELRAAGWSGGRINRQGRDRERHGRAADTVDRIERRVLVGAITERILQVVVHTEAGTDHGFIRERTPRQPDTWLRQKLCIVRGKERVSDMWLRRNNAVGECIVGGAAMRLVPA